MPRVSQWMKYTREMLQAAAADSISVAGVLRKLGLRQAGGTHAYLSRRLRQMGIDTSHFLGQGANRGMTNIGGIQKLAWRDVLVFRENGRRQKSRTLRRALLESGRLYRCAAEGCPVGDQWLCKPLVLQINHKDGNWLNDRQENLEFLCPNCHTQTPNYCRRRGVGPEVLEPELAAY